MAVSGNTFTMADSKTETFTALCGQLAGLIRSASSDFENLCASSLIKPCAKYKPEDYNILTNLTEAQRKENHYGFGKEAKVIAKSTTSAPKNTYTYIHPKGGTSSPNRMRDWDGYYHGAILPINFIFPSKLYVDYINGVELKASSIDTSRNVTLANVMNATDSTYIALFVYKNSSSQWLLPTSFKVKDLTASYSPTVFIAKDANIISQAGLQPTSLVYPYVLSDLTAGDSYTLIAVGVEGVGYQSDMLPMSISEYGNMYSTDIDNNDGGGHDRKAYTASRAKTLENLVATSFTMSATVTKASTSPGGRPAYWLAGQSSSLKVKTPAEWMFTSQDNITFRAEITSSVGYIYKTDGTPVSKIDDLSTTVKLSSSNTTYDITGLMTTIGNYNFDVWSGSNLVLSIMIYATANGETKNLGSYTFNQRLP